MSEPAAAPPLTGAAAVRLLATPPSPYAAARERIDGVDYTVFAHGPRTLPALFAMSARHADAEFLIYEAERLTFAGAHAAAANLGHALVHQLGVQKGDRVALCMRNYPEWCISYMAVTSIGAVIVPLNAWWTAAELRYAIDDCGAKVAIVDSERLPRFVEFADEVSLRVLVTRPETALPSCARELAPLLRGDHAIPAVDVTPEDHATLMYTSGSTGHPKGVLSTHHAVAASIFAWEFTGFARALMGLPGAVVDRVRPWLARGAEALNETPFNLPQRIVLVTLPLFHVTGCNVQFLTAFRSGRKLVLMRKWNPEVALELIERERVTDFTGVPTMSWELVNSPDFAKRDTSTLVTLSSGGAARPPDQVKKLKEKASRAEPGAGYGMTETNALGAAIGGNDYLARPASIGRAMPPLVELKIIDAEGHTLGADQEGEICIKSVTNMRGYWNRPEDTANTLVDGYVLTGDLGRIDAEGFLFITGRAKDIVIRGGENISCSEVEHALHEHPAVFEVAAYGVPDDRLGEALAATVMLRAGEDVSVDDLKAHLAARIAQFKIPTHLFLQRDPLPRIASGKIDKRTIKQAAEAHLATPQG